MFTDFESLVGCVHGVGIGGLHNLCTYKCVLSVLDQFLLVLEPRCSIGDCRRACIVSSECHKRRNHAWGITKVEKEG